mgnify:CR=1 FL=1
MIGIKIIKTKDVDTEKISKECWNKIERYTGFKKEFFDSLKEPRYLDLEALKMYSNSPYYEMLYILKDDLDTMNIDSYSIAGLLYPYFIMVMSGNENSPQAKDYLRMLNAAIIKYATRKGYLKKGKAKA